MSRNPSFRTVIVLSLIINISPGPTFLSAQGTPGNVPSITIRTNTRLVIVDVVVKDKKGQPVPGLKAEDFTLEEGGKKQKISVFIPPGGANKVAPAPPPSGVFSNHPESVGPSGSPLVLILDATNSLFTQQAFARSSMLNYAANQSQSGRSMAVLTLTDRLHVLQDFTSDPKILATAIRDFRPQEPILQPAPAPPGSAANPDSSVRGGAALASTLANAQAEIAAFNNLQISHEIERRTLITIEAMRSLARMLGGLQGRKTVVWLTGNLPFDLIPEDRAVSDAELLADLPGQGSQRSAAVNGAGSQASEQRSLHAKEIRDAESQLASANIAIYPVDLHGLVGGAENLATASFAHSDDINNASLANAALGQSSVLVNSQGTLKEVATETGGKAYTNQNEIQQGVALAIADDTASYELGYYPENKKWDGKYRSIKVKVAHGDTEVRYRKGYFANEPGPTKDHNPEQDVAAALQVNAPATQVSFMAQAKPTDPGKVRVVFLVDAHTLSAEDAGGNKKMSVSMYASIYDPSGKNLGTHSVKVDRAFDAATYQQILDKGMMVPIDMDIPAGGKELRLAVLDNKTGLIGTVTGPLGQ
jgi:VWFA-related protein